MNLYERDFAFITVGKVWNRHYLSWFKLMTFLNELLGDQSFRFSLALPVGGATIDTRETRFLVRFIPRRSGKNQFLRFVQLTDLCTKLVTEIDLDNHPADLVTITVGHILDGNTIPEWIGEVSSEMNLVSDQTGSFTGS